MESHLQSLSGSEGFEVFQPLFRRKNRMRRESRQQDSVLSIKARNPGHIAGIHTIHPAHHHRGRIKIALFNMREWGRHGVIFSIGRRAVTHGLLGAAKSTLEELPCCSEISVTAGHTTRLCRFRVGTGGQKLTHNHPKSTAPGFSYLAELGSRSVTA